jgi:predicted RND superfamily exporter protein
MVTSAQHPGKALAVVFTLTILFTIPASQLTIDTSIEGNLGDDLPGEVQQFERIAGEFGEQELVTVVVDCSDSTPAAAEGYLVELARSLKNGTRFTEVHYTQNLDFAPEQAILYVPENHLMFLLDSNVTLASAEQTYRALVRSLNESAYIVSADGTIYLLNMMVNVTLDSASIRTEIFDGLYDLLDEVQRRNQTYASLTVGFTGGMLVTDYEGDKLALNDMYVTAAVTFVLIIILLFVSFRSVSLPLMSLIPLVCGIAISAGIISLAFGTLSVATAIFAVLLLGLGIDFSIHLITRFLEEMEVFDDVPHAFERTAAHTGRAIVLGTLTTATAFGALYFSNTQALHEMGIILFLGLIITMLCVFAVLPALIALRFRVGKLRGSLRKRARFTLLKAMGEKTAQYAAVVVIVFIGISVAFAATAPRAELSSDLHELQPTNVPSYKQLQKVKEHFNYTEDYLLCTAGSYDALEEDVHRFKNISEVMTVESVLDLLPANQTAKLSIFEQAQTLHPEFAALSWLNVSHMTWEDLPTDLHANWVAHTSNYTNFLIRLTARGNVWDEDYRRELLPQLEEVNAGIVARALYISALIDSMTEDIIKVSVFAALPILVIVYVGFRQKSPLYALLAAVAVLFGIGGLLALSPVLGVSLNMISIMMVPLVIGIGIDDSIHILYRYREEGSGSLPTVVQHTGTAIFLTTATTCLAFSSFLFAEHPGLRSMGQVPTLGLLLCFGAAIIGLPALMQLIFERTSNGNV